MSYPTKEELEEKILLKDRDWKKIDGCLCKVADFVPMANYKDGEVVALDKTTPYASVHLIKHNFPNPTVGYITHKIDFINLWKAFKERGISDSEEVVIMWTKKSYKMPYKFFSVSLPRLVVMVLKKGAFELIHNPDLKPELSDDERWLTEKPIMEWKPEVMKSIPYSMLFLLNKVGSIYLNEMKKQGRIIKK